MDKLSIKQPQEIDPRFGEDALQYFGYERSVEFKNVSEGQVDQAYFGKLLTCGVLVTNHKKGRLRFKLIPITLNL
jgi:hypothetical protein